MPGEIGRLRWTEPVVGAAGAKSSKRPVRTDATLTLKHLNCTPDQRKAIEDLYRKCKAFVAVFTLSGDPSAALHSTDNLQQNATSILAKHGLGFNEVGDLGSRWAVCWTTSWGEGNSATTRVLYQCACGYDTLCRQQREEKKKEHQHSKLASRLNTESPQHPPSGLDPATITTPPSPATPSLPSQSHETKTEWKRHAPYNFTGCLCHADVTYRDAGRQVIRIMGHFQHNQKCQDSFMVRRPPIPLHPHVYELALCQMKTGADISAVKRMNRHYIKQEYYYGMKEDPGFWNHRYLILRADSSRLYRALARQQGINTILKPEHNIHNWLDAASPAFQPLLADAVFHYSARTCRDERFKVCIATKEMEEATWLYGHESQIVLDGTFGLCDSRLLLFIVMGIDEEQKGVPLAFFLFSAPAGNRQTAAGYDTEVLSELLAGWKSWLERGGRMFKPLVAITDTDTKERAALLRVCPWIILLLCKFHLRQCWTNKRRTLFGGDEDGDFIKQQAKNELLTLEVALIESMEHDHAVDMVMKQRARFQSMQAFRETEATGKAGIAFLDYLLEYWLTPSLWLSWSLAGRRRAADALNRPVEGILPTTNHLESFNRVLKRDHIRRIEKAGKRLRIDVLFHSLITKIIPAIFETRRLLLDYRIWRHNRFPGGALLGRPEDRHQQPSYPPLAWIPSTAEATTRQLEGKDIAKLGRVHSVCWMDAGRTMGAKCLSSKSLPIDGDPTMYTLCLQFGGFGWCNCPDFRFRSAHVGICKHLYAFLEYLAQWRRTAPHHAIPAFVLPSNPNDALALHHSQAASFPIPPLSPTQTPTTLAKVASILDDMLEAEGVALSEKFSVDSDILVDAVLSQEPTEAISGESPRMQEVATQAVVVKSYPHHTDKSVDGLALQDQLQIHIIHVARKLLPPLYQLETLLKDATPSRTADLVELSCILTRLHLDLARQLAQATEIESSTSQSTVSTRPRTPEAEQFCASRAVTPTPVAEPRRAILPPSPEVRQVRKVSYGVI